MKKAVSGFLLAVFSLVVLGSCSKQSISVPAYPLNEETISAVLKEYGFSAKIEETDNSENMTLFNITSAENGEFQFGISSAAVGDERTLFISVTPHFMANAIPVEDCEVAICMATSLFGGFESENKVYDLFSKEYVSGQNIERQEFEIDTSSKMPNQREAEVRWVGTIDGIRCEIYTVQPRLDDSEEYLSHFRFYTDQYVFST